MKRFAIEDVRDNDPDASGIRPRRSTAHEKPTGRVPRADLERLLAEDAERARAEARGEQPDLCEHTRLVSRAWVLPAEEMAAPQRLELDLPLIAQKRYAPVSIPPPPIPPFELRRAARDEARRTKRIVVAIWAFALTLSGGLGYFVASQN
jgi:hypothetical protein